MKLFAKSLVIFSLLATTQNARSLTNSIAIEDNNFQNNLFISSAALAEDGSDVTGYCNATAISAQVLVTAAHCIAESLALAKNQIHVEVGSYKFVTRKTDGKQVRIGYVPFYKKDLSAHFIVSKNLQKKLTENGPTAQIPPAEDVALIVLNDKLELDANFNYANVVPQKIWSSIKNHLSAAQFFIVSTNYLEISSADFKRSATLNSFSFNSAGWLESQSGSRVEEGDSGSPVYINYQGHTYIVGVVKGLASNIFSNWDVLPTLSNKACDIARENAVATEVSNLVCK